MIVLQNAWGFFQDEILGMKWLSRLIGSLLSAYGVDTPGKIGSPAGLLSGMLKTSRR